MIVGCGDVARRTLPRLLGHYRIFAVLRDSAQLSFWRSTGAMPILANLDHAASLNRISGLADIILHFAPPADSGVEDGRTRKLLAALGHSRSLPRRLIYISTSGVYGDCSGARIDETRRLHPTTPRAQRRVDAERQLRRFGARLGVCVTILRAPGIYSVDRLPITRLEQGLCALSEADDVFTNHIHADDLALLVCAALCRGRANRCYNASDDSEIKMGDYFDLVADRFALPRPNRISRADAQRTLPAQQFSFMCESRRLDNRRSKKELRARLRYPLVSDGIDAAWQERKH